VAVDPCVARSYDQCPCGIGPCVQSIPPACHVTDIDETQVIYLDGRKFIVDAVYTTRDSDDSKRISEEIQCKSEATHNKLMTCRV